MTVHIPVLMQECLAGLRLKPGGIYIDGTLGGGGHSFEIIKQIGPGGVLIAIDRDPDAVAAAELKLQPVAESSQVTLQCHQGNYADIPELLHQLGFGPVDGILLDLGLSSDQLEDRDRGFSYNADGMLDLRFDRQAGEPAWRLVNRLGQKHLADLIFEFGEERYSRRVARNICKARHDEKIVTASQLASIVRRSVPRSRNHSIDPATRTFQALRIAVNEELKWLKIAMKRLPSSLAGRGRIVIISFHSLEDRLVKEGFNESSILDIVNRKPIRAGEEEIATNSRSRSAKFRVAERRVE